MFNVIKMKGRVFNNKRRCEMTANKPGLSVFGFGVSEKPTQQPLDRSSHSLTFGLAEKISAQT